MRDGLDSARHDSALFRRRDNKPRPARKKTKTAERRNRPKPIRRLPDQRHKVQTAAKQKNAGKEQPPRTAIDRAVKRKHEQRDRVNEMIKHSLVPDIYHATHFKGRS